MYFNVSKKSGFIIMSVEIYNAVSYGRLLWETIFQIVIYQHNIEE